MTDASDTDTESVNNEQTTENQDTEHTGEEDTGKTEEKTKGTGEDGDNASLIHYKDVLPSHLHILPLLNRPFFPGQVVPLLIEAEGWKKTIKAIVETEHQVFGLILMHNEDIKDLRQENFHQMGTACRLHRVIKEDDKLQILVEGLQRFRIESWVTQKQPLVIQPHYYPEEKHDKVDELKAYILAVINTIKELLPLNPLYGEELKIFLDRFGADDPSHLGDFAASLTTSSKQELQNILETLPILKRLEKVLQLLNQELQTARAQEQIRQQVESKMDKQEREFLLREQLKVIQKELGLEKDDRTSELEKFQERLKKLKLPDATAKVIEEETRKLSMLETGSPEYTVSRNYLDWLTLMPWGVYSKDKLHIQKARKILDRDHEALKDVKDRIIEFIGVGKLRGSIGGTILLLVGPPGVGKTSIGRSIADAIGRQFFRFSVGGIRDEAEIKGHRRTYIGAMPGKFIQAMKEVGTANPVIMLDEIDKIGASYHGDPASALLEVLDPEQNTDFLDHYLDVRFDLSKVLFICTANQLDTIPPPLLDRMETIHLSGYLTSEKLRIAKKHLLRRQLEKTGLKKTDVRFTDATICQIIEQYAREAGVRTLEKRLGAACRKAAIKILEGEKPPIKISTKNLENYLGRPVFEKEPPLHGIGIVTGLAWTALGGAIMSIEARRIHGYSRGFKLTGQLGDVMRESAEIAYSFVLSESAHFGISADYFEKALIHLHVPAGATPKDGPSAGITMTSALISLGLNKTIKHGFAMTGELSLTGEVLPIGGIQEKVIAARRVNIFKLIVPHANKGDFEELPEHIREGVHAHFVKNYKEVFKLLF
ncbi:endopeptidase La [Candidatus Venteria ishoeyi]|uniref:Lon protease n=1 Tax=Candidatus Venteria ishoeyi TaxID=1899563 RepID=A0A1H6FFV8_9GAMM|nr:endopeptidase La [Candidatus Venteria ishoeyi]SEH07894.1 Lon protease [Candidatus Venteria ishoeyi]